MKPADREDLILRSDQDREWNLVERLNSAGPLGMIVFRGHW